MCSVHSFLLCVVDTPQLGVVEIDAFNESVEDSYPDLYVQFLALEHTSQLLVCL